MGFAEGGLLHAGKGPRAPGSRVQWMEVSEQSSRCATTHQGLQHLGLTAAWICLLRALGVTERDGLSTPRPGGELDRDMGPSVWKGVTDGQEGAGGREGAEESRWTGGWQGLKGQRHT